MADTLIGAMKALFCLNRWNMQPRIETWTEAENIAFCAHVVYAIGCQSGLDDDVLYHAVTRTLLKSLNKHYLSDISVDIRDRIRRRDASAWARIVNEAAEVTARLVRSDARDAIRSYLTFEGSYGSGTRGPRISAGMKKRIENLVSFCQYRVAQIECEPNLQAFRYPQSDYEEKFEQIDAKMRALDGYDELRRATEELTEYIYLIRSLKHARRWNRMNRFIESSVLAHIFLVAVLVVIFSETLSGRLNDFRTKHARFRAILWGLFHDLPEMLTGDLITPVKEIIDRNAPDLLQQVQCDLIAEMSERLPDPLRQRIEAGRLLAEPSKDSPFSIASLVKDCDTLAALLECAFEKSVGNNNPEIGRAFARYVGALQNSEFDVVREFAQRVVYELDSNLF